MKAKWTAIKKPHKAIIISVLAVLIVAAGTMTAFAIGAERERTAHAAVVEKLTEDFNSQEQELINISELAEKLTDNDFLIADISENDIQALEKMLTEIRQITVEEKFQEDIKEQTTKTDVKKKEVKKLLEAIKAKFDVQTNVNTLFTSPALVGNKITENLVIADDLDNGKLSEVKTKFYIEETESEWQKAINSLVNEAETQVKHIDYVKSEIAKHLVDGSLVADSGLNPDIVNNTKAIAEQIKNETIKNSLAEQAKQIETLYNEKIRVAAEAQAAEVGGTAEKQENGTYKVVASDHSEYAVSNTGEVTKTKDAPPAASYSSGGSSSGGSSTGSSGSSSSGGSSSNSGSTGSSGGSSNSTGSSNSNGGYTSIEAEMHYGGYVAGGHFGGDGDNTWYYSDEFYAPDDWNWD